MVVTYSFPADLRHTATVRADPRVVAFFLSDVFYGCKSDTARVTWLTEPIAIRAHIVTCLHRVQTRRHGHGLVG